MGRNIWNSIASWFGGRGARRIKETPFRPACHVYFRADGIWVFPTNTLCGAGGGIGLTVGPALKVEASADAPTLGEAILASMARSRLQTVTQDELSRLARSNVAKEAGFKSLSDLERWAKLLSVRRADSGVTVGAWAACADGSYVPVRDGERGCEPNAASIGELVVELARLCVARAPAKRRRKTRAGSVPPRGGDPNDTPVSFGYKMTWIAVPAVDGAIIAEALGLKELRRCTWSEGIERADKHDGVFITRPVDGWTIAAGSLPDAEEDTFASWLEDLSRRFGTVFYFGTHRVVGYQAWAHAENGGIRRAFAYLGERGELLLNLGERTSEEIAVGTGVEDLECAPDEQTVLALAGEWVLDPRELNEVAGAEGPGWFGVR